MVDPTLVVAAASLILAVASLVYARGQAVAGKLQAEAAIMTAQLEMREHSTGRRREAVRELFRHPHLEEEYIRVNGEVAAATEVVGGLQPFLSMRAFLVSMQVEYELRKAGITDAKDWAMAMAGLRPIFRMPSFRAYFENEVRRGIFEEEFLAAHRALLDDQIPADPGTRKRNLKAN